MPLQAAPDFNDLLATLESVREFETAALYLLAFVAGIIAGGINTLAGAGSLITLPVLFLMGLSPHDANATNRLGVIFQSLSGMYGFRKNDALPAENIQWYVVPATVGAIAGAWAAVAIDADSMRYSILGAMLLVLGLLFLEPKRWLREQSEDGDAYRRPLALAILFAIGFYGGFVQAGVGVLLLAGLVLGSGRSLLEANALKLWIVLIATIPALAFFLYYDQVRFGPGLTLAAGQLLGAYLAANYASQSPRANIWIRRLLIVITIAAILRLV
ncbi:MAG: sulfite exporter TauE/SafE family protein [bacterium]|nr:sulfite exporter TauE/SafE family protein [bacterium]